MRITEKGQVTIPVEVRRKLGLNPGDEVEFVLEGNGARVVRAATVPSRGKRLVERL
ncbi:MAG: AbrB/MazE/SpoVT family DNA-binding domain-containing protein, partial [Nocardiopsis sp. BM-2018]